MHSAVWKLETSETGTLIYWDRSGHLCAVRCQLCGLKKCLYLENSGESASNAQYAQVLRATDGKVGIPGQVMVRVQWSRAAWRMVAHSVLFHPCYSVSLSV